MADAFIRQLHFRFEPPPDHPEYGLCNECDQTWPCPTIRLLNGEAVQLGDDWIGGETRPEGWLDDCVPEMGRHVECIHAKKLAMGDPNWKDD